MQPLELVRTSMQTSSGTLTLAAALQADGCRLTALVLSESSSPAASEPQGEPLSKPLNTPLAEPPNESAAFWRAAAELGFWACAGAQLTTAGLQQIGTLTLNLT